MSLTLAQALRVDESNRIAFVGSGGKTTAMFQLARQITPPIIITATSHLGTWQTSLADTHIIANSPKALAHLDESLSGIVLITGEADDNRMKPVGDSVLDSIHRFCLDLAIPMLIEADGSRQKPLKGWADHEPAIPDFADQVVQVTGLSGLRKPLTDEFVHRPEIFSKLSEIQLNDPIEAEGIVKALLHPDSARKNFPHGARHTVMLNQAGTPELQASARGMAQSLLEGFDSVIISELEKERIYAVHEHVAGVILAAGESSRYGEPKQLLDWHGEPFVRAVAKKALEAGLSPVLLIVGAHKDDVVTVMNDLDIRMVENPNWKEGQSTSIKAGIKAIHSEKPNVGAAVFLLVDQPQITTSILQGLIEKHAEGRYPIVAPMVIDRRANPILFDRRTFPDLRTIEGDVGGRAIFHKYQVEYLPWHDDRLLLDVDTPEHYQRLLADESL